jgi:hypothetical protein
MSTSSIGANSTGVLGAGVWSLWGTPDPNPSNARAVWDAEGATFENQSYRIRIDADQTVLVANQRTGESYAAFAPTHNEAACCSILSLLLDDGTKLTLETFATSTDADGLVLDSQRNVTITTHDFGLQVSGLGSDAGFKAVQTVAYGWLLDGAVADGHVLQENAQGAGLIGHDPQNAWQVMGQDLITLKELEALTAMSPWLGEGLKALVSLQCLLSITMVGTHRMLTTMSAEDRHKSGPMQQVKRRHPEPDGWQLERANPDSDGRFLLRPVRHNRTLGRALDGAGTGW